MRRESVVDGNPPTATQVLTAYENVQSRGKLVDFMLDLRDNLSRLRATLPDPPAPLNEPFDAEIQYVLDAGEQLQRGQDVAISELYDRIKGLGEVVIGAFDTLFTQISNSQMPTDAGLLQLAAAMGQPQFGPGQEPEAAAAYLDYWIGNIDRGLGNWSAFGLATTRALLFDPQSKRDLQNRESVSEGPDAVDPAFKTQFSFDAPLTDPRSAAENDIGVLGTFLDELEDPDNDGKTDDSFVSQYLMPMFGMPRRFGDLKAGFESFLDSLEDKILRPTRELLQDVPSPLDVIVEFIKEKVVEYVKEQARDAIFDATGVDIIFIEFLLDTNASSLLGLKSITIGGLTSDVFQPTDHDRLDHILGFTSTDFTEPLDVSAIQDRLDELNAQALADNPAAQPVELEFYAGARGRLKANAEFDKAKFAPYANSVTMSKMLLLQENLNGDAPIGGLQPKTVSRLLSDLTGQPYDFAQLTLNSSISGGNIMTATLPGATDAFGEPSSVVQTYLGPISSDVWMSSIDGDHNWRQDSQTRASEVYRFHDVGTGDNKVVWNFTGLAPGHEYFLQTDWRVNEHVSDQGRIQPAHAAFYSVSTNNGATQLDTALIDQRTFPDDQLVIPDDPDSFEPAGQAWEFLRAMPFVAGADGTLRVELSDDLFGDGIPNDEAQGGFVVAGRVRLFEKGLEDATEQIITNRDPGYSQISITLNTVNPSPAGAAAALDGRMIPQALLDALASAPIDDSDSFLHERDFLDFDTFVLKLGVGLGVAQLPVALQNLIVAAGIDLDLVSAFLAGQIDLLTPGGPLDTGQLLLESLTDEASKDVLIDRLNTILRGPSIHTAARFVNVEVLQSTFALQQSNPAQGSERLIRLNRLLLEDAYRGEINRSLDPGFVVHVVTPGQEWRLVRRDKVEPVKGNDKIGYGTQYSVVLSGGGLVIKEPWRGTEYQVGRGNFPLWESELLRDSAFRVLFQDWQDGTENFPDVDQGIDKRLGEFGDPTSSDPNSLTPPGPIAYGTFPAYVPYTPTAIGPSVATPGANTLVVSGNMTLNVLGNQTYVMIVGDGDGIPDSLTLTVTGDVNLDGFVGGLGLTNITITAIEVPTANGPQGGTITVADGTTISSRQVVAGGDHWNASSTASSGDISLLGRRILVGDEANLLAHADGGFAAGDVTLTAEDTYEQTWSYLFIPNYRWIETEATIDVGADSYLTGHDVVLTTNAETEKTATFGDPDNLDAFDEFSTPTRAVALGDLDKNPATNRHDLVVGTLGRGILLYHNEFQVLHPERNPYRSLPTAIDSDLSLNTVSLALGDVDNDGAVDLVSGNFGQANRLYLNATVGNFPAAFAAGVAIDVARNTTEVALANLDADPQLELVVATHDAGVGRVLVYQFNPVTGAFGAPTEIDSGAFQRVLWPWATSTTTATSTWWSVIEVSRTACT